MEEKVDNSTQGSGEAAPREAGQDVGGLVDGTEGGGIPGATDGQGVGLGSESDNIPPVIEAQPEAVLEPSEPVVEQVSATEEPVNDQTPKPNDQPNPNDQNLRTEAENKGSFIRNLLVKAGEKIQFNKKKKLEKVMELAQKKTKISNRDVCLALRVSDVTAFRYLDILEKQGKIKQAGKTGRDVFYQLVP